jgi:hypothetical protein
LLNLSKFCVVGWISEFSSSVVKYSDVCLAEFDHNRIVEHGEYCIW